MKHLSVMLGVCSSASHWFHPFGYIVHSYQDVLTVMGLWEWSREINAPHIKYFYLKVVVEGHCIPSCDVPLILALLAPSNEFFGVVLHGWIVESTLPDLGLCAEHSIMASVWSRMTFLDDLPSFSCGYTSPQQTI
jgi:hypothetical protein